jgi:hypothetical protein
VITQSIDQFCHIFETSTGKRSDLNKSKFDPMSLEAGGAKQREESAIENV